MSKPNDGGPAFPFPSGPEPRANEFHDRCEGMSLRQYYAGLALASTRERDFSDDLKQVQRAVSIADALIAELEKESP